METAVAVFEVAALDVTFTLVTAGAVIAAVAAIAIIAVHLRTDDGAGRNAADDAGRDLAVARGRRLRREGDAQGQCSNSGGSNDFKAVMTLNMWDSFVVTGKNNYSMIWTI